jgi:hypothetical protein
MIKKFTLQLTIDNNTTVTNSLSIVDNNVVTNKLLSSAFKNPYTAVAATAGSCIFCWFSAASRESSFYPK